MIDPELRLTEAERAELASFVTLRGFEIMQKIMGSECAKFQTALLNADPTNSAHVLAAHNLAKAAAQFYVGVTNRINLELEVFHQARAFTPEPDVTEGLLD